MSGVHRPLIEVPEWPLSTDVPLINCFLDPLGSGTAWALPCLHPGGSSKPPPRPARSNRSMSSHPSHRQFHAVAKLLLDDEADLTGYAGRLRRVAHDLVNQLAGTAEQGSWRTLHSLHQEV